MKTRQAALRDRAGYYANLGKGYLATAGKTPEIPGQIQALKKAVEAYSAYDDILAQIDGPTRKVP